MKRTRQTIAAPPANLYADSWQCSICDYRFLTFREHIAPDASVIACPWCHYVGQFTHWRVTLPPETRLEDVHPYPQSQLVDAEDAQIFQRRMSWGAPGVLEYYQRTGIIPWGVDQRPQPDVADYKGKARRPRRNAERIT